MAAPTHEAVTADPRLQLIYEESVRKLEQQAATLESVRGRTGLLLGAGTLSSAFVAAEGIKHAGWAWQAWLALFFQVGTSVLLMMILLPYKGWAFTHKIGGMIHVYVDGPKPRTIRGMHRQLAKVNDANYVGNRKLLGRLQVYYELATVSLLVSMLFWLLLLTR